MLPSSALFAVDSLPLDDYETFFATIIVKLKKTATDYIVRSI